MDAVVIIDEQLIDHRDRIGAVTALGLDETLFARVGWFRTQTWSTQIVDVRRGQLLDVVPGRTASEPCRWLAARDQIWRDEIEWATLDLSASYRVVFDTMLPHATQVADPFHVVKLANTAVDECRRTLEDAPWKFCGCGICGQVGIEVSLFLGSERNKRRGFHNLAVFRNRLNNTLNHPLNEGSHDDRR
jgi:hypothetical protein